MKKALIYIILLSSGFIACNKDPKPVSKVVNAGVTITLKGSDVSSTGIGSGTYTDEGATAHDNATGEDIPLTPTENTVDLTKPGFYYVAYHYVSVNGYVADAFRLVLVTSVSASQDYSGTYFRTSNNQTVTFTKKATGLYTTDNVGGVPGNPAFIFPIYFGLTNDSTLVVPTQVSPLGNLYCDNTKVNVSGSDTSFAWIVRCAPSFGTAVRTFSHK
jgi:hypothetical protein